jgi:hypothetical protein
MSVGAEVNLDVIARLPSDLQAMLKRKSSRDPESRFTSKISALLNYVARSPESEDNIGICWIDDATFKMKKRVLISVLGIKLNTLNVNLRDLHFTQQPSAAKDGWTYWQKEGFTRASISLLEIPMRDAAPKAAQAGKQPGPFTLGCVNADGLALFFQEAERLWRELTGAPFVQVFETGSFLQRAARLFKQDGQQEQNALDVLTAIIIPKRMEHTTFERFARFLAMFGPERTVMLKIASLLDCSHRTGQWLYFDTDGMQMPALSGSFDLYEPNCLVIRNSGTVTRVWNAPLIEANDKTGYVTDDKGHSYHSWADYFEAHPVGSVICDLGVLSYQY